MDEYKRRMEHFSIFKQYYHSYKVLRDAFMKAEYKTSLVHGYLRGAYSLLHIALESLIKSGLPNPVISHDLLKLNKLFEEAYKKKTPKELLDVLTEINPYGHPVSDSLRYKYDASFPIYLIDQDWSHFITTDIWKTSYTVGENNTEEWFWRRHNLKVQRLQREAKERGRDANK